MTTRMRRCTPVVLSVITPEGDGGIASRMVGVDEDFPLGLLLSSWGGGEVAFLAMAVQ